MAAGGIWLSVVFPAVIGLSFVFDFLGDTVLSEDFLAEIPVAIFFAHLFLERH
jgi:hypothetical protein